MTPVSVLTCVASNLVVRTDTTPADIHGHDKNYDDSRMDMLVGHHRIVLTSASVMESSSSSEHRVSGPTNMFVQTNKDFGKCVVCTLSWIIIIGWTGYSEMNRVIISYFLSEFLFQTKIPEYPKHRLKPHELGRTNLRLSTVETDLQWIMRVDFGERIHCLWMKFRCWVETLNDANAATPNVTNPVQFWIRKLRKRILVYDDEDVTVLLKKWSRKRLINNQQSKSIVSLD